MTSEKDPADEVVPSDFAHSSRPYKPLLIGAAVLLAFFIGLVVWLFISGITSESNEDQASAACRTAVAEDRGVSVERLAFADESVEMFGNSNWRVSGSVNTPGNPEAPGTTKYNCIYGGDQVIDLELTPSAQ